MNFQDVIRDVHDPSTHSLQTSNGGATIFAVVNTGTAGDSVNNIGFATVSISNPTLYAVVNTGASAIQNSMVTINPRTDYVGLMSISGNVNLNASVNNVGFATVSVSNPTLYAVVNTTASSGQVTVTLNNTPTIYAVVNTSAAGVVNSITTIAPRIDYIGLMSVSGNVILGASPSFVGIVTTANQPALVTSTANIGSVSVLGGSVGINAGVNGIGFATVKVDTGTKYIGLVTIDVGTIKAWTNPNTFIGLVTVAPHALTASTVNIGSVSVLGGGIGLNAGVNFIGFATVWGLNVGTNKTLINLPIGFSTASVVTVAVPTNVNTIKITNMLLNSDATVRFTIKSGVTYLTGNASIGITLNPGGGFIMTGAPDSPSWIGLPSGALVIEKLDLTATAAKIAGNVVYFQE